MEVIKAEYVKSSPSVVVCPDDVRNEYAFIGRSNVGKSSLINMLCRNSKLAKTSATPGKTMMINHFLINDEWYIVDLPGYGYAKRSKREVEKLDRMIRAYLLMRSQLQNVFLLIDIRLEPQRIDLDFIQFLGENGIPFTIVFTKADKISKGRALQNVSDYCHLLQQSWEELPPYYITSSQTRQGRDDILAYIEKCNSILPSA